MKIKQFVCMHRWKSVSVILKRIAMRAYANSYIRRCVRIFFTQPKPLKWVFPMGCYNSGTTMTQTILAAHQDFTTLPREGVRFTSLLPQPEDLGWTRMWVSCESYMDNSLSQGPVESTYKSIVADWAPWLSTVRSVCMDKSITNGARIQWMDEVFPSAYFIGIVRNGYAACEGMQRKARPKKGARVINGSDTYSLPQVGLQWVASNRKLLDEQTKVNKFLLVKYEELLDDPINELNKIWAFLDVEPPTEMYMDGEALVINGYRLPLLKNTNEESMTRLGTKGVEELEPIIGNMMVELGYV